MAAPEPPVNAPDPAAADSPTWTYPTRSCRICWEEVNPTVTMYPPGIPMQFQRAIVEYKNDDEYGRLVKPCMCKGSSRYIHELCLRRSRTENDRKNSMWVCHECTHKFNFQKLTLHRWLSSKIAAGILTVFFMIYLMFVLGFIADPIINIYMDPYDSLMDLESIWDELEVRTVKQSQFSAWTQHFAKGFISIGLVGFLKTLLLNPFQWINLRWGSGLSSRASNTGRNRAVNISWIALLIGICSAFVFFYKWVQAIMQRMLIRLGNNIVDTKLPGDDDDLKPPPGWRPTAAPAMSTEHTPESQPDYEASSIVEESNTEQKNPGATKPLPHPSPVDDSVQTEAVSNESTQPSTPRETSTPAMSGSWVAVEGDAHDEQNLLSGVHRQGWSFSNL